MMTHVFFLDLPPTPYRRRSPFLLSFRRSLSLADLSRGDPPKVVLDPSPQPWGEESIREDFEEGGISLRKARGPANCEKRHELEGRGEGTGVNQVHPTPRCSA